MIAANELRIGNYTNFGKVYQIEEDCFYTMKDEVSFKSSWADIQPIPLSPEVLERCGFEKHEFNKTYTNGSVGFDYDEDGFYIKNYDAKDDFITCHKISWVHQLQNLIHALTGEELEVNL